MPAYVVARGFGIVNSTGDWIMYLQNEEQSQPFETRECLACFETFVIEANERAWYVQKFGTEKDATPRRCKACRAKRRQQKQGNGQ